MSPFPSRVFISDQIQELSGFSGNIVGHDIGAFLLYIYMWKVANIITLILLDAEDLKIEGFEKNDGARENFNFSLKNWRKIWISFLAQPGRKLN